MKLTEKSADNKVKRWGKGGREGVSAPTLCTVSTPCAFPFNKWLYNYFIILKMWSLSCILLIHLLLLTSCSFKFILKWRGEKHISVSCIIYYLTWHFIQRNILLNHTIAFVVFLSLWPSVEKRWYSCFKCQIHYSLETWARSLTWHHLTDFVLLFSYHVGNWLHLWTLHLRVNRTFQAFRPSPSLKAEAPELSVPRHRPRACALDCVASPQRKIMCFLSLHSR